MKVLKNHPLQEESAKRVTSNIFKVLSKSLKAIGGEFFEEVNGNVDAYSFPEKMSKQDVARELYNNLYKQGYDVSLDNNVIDIEDPSGKRGVHVRILSSDSDFDGCVVYDIEMVKWAN